MSKERTEKKSRMKKDTGSLDTKEQSRIVKVRQAWRNKKRKQGDYFVPPIWDINARGKCCLVPGI